MQAQAVRAHWQGEVDKAIGAAYVRQSSKAALDTRGCFANWDWLDLGELAATLPVPSFAPPAYGECLRRAVTSAELGDWRMTVNWLNSTWEALECLAPSDYEATWAARFDRLSDIAESFIKLARCNRK